MCRYWGPQPVLPRWVARSFKARGLSVSHFLLKFGATALFMALVVAFAGPLGTAFVQQSAQQALGQESRALEACTKISKSPSGSLPEVRLLRPGAWLGQQKYPEAGE